PHFLTLHVIFFSLFLSQVTLQHRDCICRQTYISWLFIFPPVIYFFLDFLLSLSPSYFILSTLLFFFILFTSDFVIPSLFYPSSNFYILSSFSAFSFYLILNVF